MKRYRVSGEQWVLGRQPGEEFEEEIPEAQEKRLIDRGAIEILKAKKQPQPSPESAQPGEEKSGSLFGGRKKEVENG